MKILSRDFTTKERILLLLLVLVLVALVYYQFVHKPVTESLDKLANEKSNLETELVTVEAKVAQLQKMQSEINDIEKSGVYKEMPSYNNSKNVNEFLNNVLGDMGYSINFSNITRSNNQVRRSISLQFNAPDYAAVETVLGKLSACDYRCLIGDVRVTHNSRYLYEDQDQYRAYTVVCTATFFETMVGGTADDGLPE